MLIFNLILKYFLFFTIFRALNYKDFFYILVIISYIAIKIKKYVLNLHQNVFLGFFIL